MQKNNREVSPPDFFFCGDGVNSRIKLSARAAICGSYFKVVPAVAAMMLLTVVFSLGNAAVNYFFANEAEALLAAVAALTLPLAVAVTAPLRLRLQMKFLMLAKGRNQFGKPEMSFGDALKACELSVRLFFLKLFWFAVFEAVPLMAGAAFIYHNYYNAVSLRAAYAVLTGLSVLAAAGLIFYFVFIQRYSKAWFFLACYGDFTAGDAIKESVRKTQNKLAYIFFFKLSFAPWFLLCIGILPAFYVVPYYKQSVTCLFLSR